MEIFFYGKPYFKIWDKNCDFIFVWIFLWEIYSFASIDDNTMKKSTFSSQKYETFEPVVRFGWVLFIKCRLLMRLSSWSSLNFRRWQMNCWRCLEGTGKWIPRHFPPNTIQNFLVLMLLIGVGDYLICVENLVEKLKIFWWLNRLI